MAAETENSASDSPSRAKAADKPDVVSTEQQDNVAASNGNDKGNKKRPDMGRKEFNRQKPDKRKANADWNENKRRRTDEYGNNIESKPGPANPFSQAEIAAEERKPKRKVAVMIGYAGTGYKGMQLNNDEPTIERDLFRAFVAAGAISKANADDPKKSSLSRCARTDKGVHAAGNVISLKLIIEDPQVVEKINEELPSQIRVWGIQRTNNSYNSYQYCDSRWYEYLMPSYCLLPPHPNSYLGQQLAEINKEYGAEEEVATKLADVKDFWANVEEKSIKPILESMTPEIRARVLERVQAEILSTPPDAETTEADAQGEAAAEVTSGKEAEAEKTAVDAPEDKTEETSVPAGSVQPKNRQLNNIDFALKDIKDAYVAAKRAYRISPERLQQLQAVLDKYLGTRNYHNYTVQKAFSDPSAMRHIKSFVVNPKPIIIGDTEWLSLKVHGQSFMMHQIRKMVGLASLMVRCGTSLDRVDDSYKKSKMAIPKAPGLGLLLERPVFENYNKRATDSLGREEIDFDKYEKELEAFKHKEIYQRIFEVEERESSFHGFFNQIDQFKSKHFLWLSAGGVAVADAGKGSKDVDKQLGDEDEDPEGGEG